MNYRNILATNKIKLLCLLIPIVIVGFSCKNHENNKRKVVALPIGKWKIIQLKNPQINIVFDTTRTYSLEHNTQNKIIISAEDNSLSGELIVVNNDSIKIENVTITDVCCNSEAAKLLFHFFDGTIKYEQFGHKIILSSNKAVVVLEK